MSLRDHVQTIINDGSNAAAATRTRYRDAAMNWIALGVLSAPGTWKRASTAPRER